MNNKELIFLDNLKKRYDVINGELKYLKYNCKQCHKIMYTQPYGSYKYCLSCFNEWEKNKRNWKRNKDVDIDFID